MSNDKLSGKIWQIIGNMTSTATNYVEPPSEDIIKLGPGKFMCSCGKVFRSTYQVKEHERRHKGEKPFKCNWPDCGKGFASKRELNLHEFSHSDIRRYKCNWHGCGKSFTRCNILYYHIKTHTGEKPFKCNGCGKTFQRKPSLEVHYRRIHTGERPFKCTWKNCGAKYAVKYELNQHLHKHKAEAGIQ